MRRTIHLLGRASPFAAGRPLSHTGSITSSPPTTTTSYNPASTSLSSKFRLLQRNAFGTSSSRAKIRAAMAPPQQADQQAATTTSGQTLVPGPGHPTAEAAPEPGLPEASQEGRLQAGAAADTALQTSTQHNPPLALPSTEDVDGGGVRKLDVSGGEATMSLSHLGPMVIHKDGTMSRIANWAEMTEIERQNTLRVLGKRNQIRLTDLRSEAAAAGAGSAGAEATRTETAGDPKA